MRISSVPAVRGKRVGGKVAISCGTDSIILKDQFFRSWGGVDEIRFAAALSAVHEVDAAKALKAFTPARTGCPPCGTPRQVLPARGVI